MMATPIFRFKGFTDDWEQRKLGDVGNAKSGIGFPDAEQGGEEGIPFFKVSDMNLDGNENELIRANNYVTQEQVKRKRWNVIDDVPAIFFAKVGAAVMLNRKRLVKMPFLLDNNTMAYIFDSNVWDSEFGKTLFETIDLTKLTQVGALPSYNASDVEDISIMMPSRKEQSRIGEYFSNLDHLITLHQRKCDALKDLKKGMLQKMFPKDGAKVPEFRFKGFTGDWEQRKFGEFAQRQSETRMSDSETPCVEYEDVIAEQGVLNKDIRSKESNKTGITFSEEDVLYGKLRPYLHNWLNPDFKGVAVGDWWVLKPQDMDKNFLYRLLQTPQFDDAANQSTGTKMPRADWKLISNLDFRVPASIEEQAKIGRHFNNLDNLIALHQRKCDALKDLKKGMLQKMFV